jgi:tRNA(Ile)-lysidine synthase
LTLSPGERALWDGRFRVELRAQECEPVTVRALGEAGWRDASGASDWLAALPRFAGATLPACWRGDALIFVPELDRKGSLGRGHAAQRFLASFVNAPGRNDAIRA